MKNIPKSLTIFSIKFVLDKDKKDYDYKYYYLIKNFQVKLSINENFNLACFNYNGKKIYADIDESLSKKEIEKEIEREILYFFNLPISFFEGIIRSKKVSSLK